MAVINFSYCKQVVKRLFAGICSGLGNHSDCVNREENSSDQAAVIRHRFQGEVRIAALVVALPRWRLRPQYEFTRSTE
jgi:hypothetical protein